jgi:ribose transport system ATP-binding protein
LRFDTGRFGSNITELSGGNQQKVLVARALVTDAPIILLDDPTRGVDVATKQDFYRIARQSAERGKLLFWHTTEDSEFLLCDRVLVFAEGGVVAELSGSQITEEAIIAASFQHRTDRAQVQGPRRGLVGLGHWLGQFAPILSLAAVLGVMTWANPNTVTVFGLDLLLMPAVALVLVAVAQMFIVGGSEIDLGAGAFAALISVLAATLLGDQPLWGALAIGAALAAYSSLGALIHARAIPAIVVTLGASFIWLGIGYSIQPTPGGFAPEWLSRLFFWSVPNVPSSVIFITVIGAVGLFLNRTWLGVVLRGFGNNAGAMARSGWSPLRYAVMRYLVAGIFATLAGLALTGMNTASDINSGNSFTLLSVAAVVMGGCALVGGVISPVGAVVGAVTLSLIGALLGMLNVSSDLNAMTQGFLLLGLLALRSLTSLSGEDEP